MGSINAGLKALQFPECSREEETLGVQEGPLIPGWRRGAGVGRGWVGAWRLGDIVVCVCDDPGERRGGEGGGGEEERRREGNTIPLVVLWDGPGIGGGGAALGLLGRASEQD